jgi:hypothetical protein
MSSSTWCWGSPTSSSTCGKLMPLIQIAVRLRGAAGGQRCEGWWTAVTGSRRSSGARPRKQALSGELELSSRTGLRAVMNEDGASVDGEVWERTKDGVAHQGRC